MRSTAEALNQFVGGFDLPAYTLQTVPKDVVAPYLVYPLIEPRWDQKAAFYIQGWYRTTSNAALAKKADQIIKEIGEGITLQTTSGYLVIYPETPIVQTEVKGDFRSFYINLSIMALQVPGYYPPEETPSEETPSESETPAGEEPINNQPGADPEEGETE